jgi:hypothetical protein
LRLIYEKDLQEYFDMQDEPSRFEKYRDRLINLVNRLNTERGESSTAYHLQYFKDEPIITFYTFASVAKIHRNVAAKSIWREIFYKAFRHGETLNELERLSSLKTRLVLEVPMLPTNTIKAKITEWVKNNPHPVKYLRDKFRSSRIEDPTMIDAMLSFHEDPYESSNPKAVMAFECKFMSDISSETKYHYARNQIARIIDVGWSLYGNRFYFVLVTPEVFKNRKTRLYGYKMQDYQSGDLDMLRQDLLIGSDFPDRDLELISRKIGWVSWEEMIQTLFQFRGTSPDVPFNELADFFRERKLLHAD